MTDNFIGLSNENGDFIGHIMSFLERKIIRCSPDYKWDTHVSTLNPTWSVWLKPLYNLWVCHSGGFRSLSNWGSAHPVPKIKGTERGPKKFFFSWPCGWWGPGGGPVRLTRYCVYIYEKQRPSPCNGIFFPRSGRGQLRSVQREIYSKEIALYEECVILQMWRRGRGDLRRCYFLANKNRSGDIA